MLCQLSYGHQAVSRFYQQASGVQKTGHAAATESPAVPKIHRKPL
jgi:hypothetical protein